MVVTVALMVIIAGIFVDDVILTLRDGVFSLLMAGVKLTLGTLGYTLVEHNIRGVIQAEGSYLFIIDHFRLHIRYYMLTILLLWLSISDIKNAAIAAGASVPVLFVLSVVIMSTLVVNAGETNGAEYFSFAFKGSVIAILAYFSGKRSLDYYRQMKNSDDALQKRSIRNMSRPFYYINLLLVYSTIMIIFRYSPNVDAMVAHFSDFLAALIHQTSKVLLNIFGYTPEVSGCNIRGDRAWLYIGDPCLGIKVMITFVIYVFIFPGKVFNKI